MKGKPIENTLETYTRLRIQVNNAVYVYPLTAIPDNEQYAYEDVSNMFKERDRFLSFSNARLRPNEWAGPLSEDGFYFDRHSATIRCFYCHAAPRRHQAFCNRQRCNQPMFQPTEQPNIDQTDLIRIVGAIPRNGEQPPRGRTPYQNASLRLSSLRLYCPFEDANALSSLGFYAEHAETAKCFSCGLVKAVQELRTFPWLDAHDHILTIHFEHSPQCAFLLRLLGVIPREEAGMPFAASDPCVDQSVCWSCRLPRVDVCLLHKQRNTICLICANQRDYPTCLDCGREV